MPDPAPMTSPFCAQRPKASERERFVRRQRGRIDREVLNARRHRSGEKSRFSRASRVASCAQRPKASERGEAFGVTAFETLIE